MKQPLLFLTILLAFGLATGYYAYRVTRVGAPQDYPIGGRLSMLSYPTDGEPAPHLYMRTTWSLTQRPVTAWIQAIGYDDIAVFVNGHRAGREPNEGTHRTAAVLLDIAPLLQVGQNCIAIAIRQMTQERPPSVAVEGEYVYADGQRFPLGEPQSWLVSEIYDRQGVYWYQNDFPDEQWVHPRVAENQLVYGTVDLPPASIRSHFDAPWIRSDFTAGATTRIAGTFEVADRPRGGWLRVVSTAPYRLAVNGHMIDDDLNQIGAMPPFRPSLVLYELDELLRAGTNTVAVSMVDPDDGVRIRADMQVTTAEGEVLTVRADENWYATSDLDADWVSPTLSAADGWQKCTADQGFASMPPWSTKREFRDVELTGIPSIQRYLIAAWYVIMATLIGWTGSVLTGKLASWFASQHGAEVSPHLASLALIPGALIATAAMLVDFDPDYSRWDLYQPETLLLIGFVVLAQWALVLFLALTWTKLSARSSLSAGLRWTATSSVMLVIGLVALWLRMDTITTEPIHHDEVGSYWKVVGVLQTGLPAGQVHEDIPFGIAATSELVYYPMAVATLFFDDPLLIIRVPTVAFSIATLLLLFHVGRVYFGTAAGLLAAVMFAVCPYVVAMSTFGRYFAQLQFFTLLMVHLTFLAIHTTKPIRVGYMWAATASFICMYLSWEGSGMLGPPLAIAVLWARRRRLRSLLCSIPLYGGVLMVVSVALLQNSHRLFQQTERMWYGSGISDLSLKPMWRYPLFDPFQYLLESSWARCGLIPFALMAIAILMSLSRRSLLSRRLQFLLIVLVGTSMLMGIFLPLRAARYSYHLTVLLILIAAAPLAELAKRFRGLTEGARVPVWCRGFAIASFASCFLMLAVFGSGAVFRMVVDDKLMTQSFDVAQRRSPDWDDAVRYVRENMGKDDVVICIFPHVAEHTMHELSGASMKEFPPDAWRADYWLQTTLILQATLGTEQMIPRDRRSGAEMITDVQQLKQIFENNNRVWYLTTRFSQSQINDKAVSEYLRRNMDVVYEDYITAVLVRDANHRPANIQWEDDEASQIASEFYLR